MSAVTMRHPNLPPEQTITVPEIAVGHHQAAGWRRVDDTPPAAPPEPVALEALPAAAENGDNPDPVAPKRRRTQKED